MALEKHVRLAQANTNAVNQWRSTHPETVLDLSGADLQGALLPLAKLERADLSGANLTEANLNRAELRNANMRGAKLNGAYLSRADLSHADLAHADLHAVRMFHAILMGTDLSAATLTEAQMVAAHAVGAELTNADLTGANLDFANLTDANLTGAVLRQAMLHDTKLCNAAVSEADFTGAIFMGCVLTSLDLSRAKGLDAAHHLRASSVGIDTIVKSRKNPPLKFLRNCGVPEEILAYLPSLAGQVLDSHSSFISYSGKDDDFARRLHSRLQEEKVPVWFAPEDMRGGRLSHDQIDSAIRGHDKLLLILSPASMTSEWVKLEIRKALEDGKNRGSQKLFPIRLCGFSKLEKWKCLDENGNDLAIEVRKFHIPDFSNWENDECFESALLKLLRDLRKGEPSAAGGPANVSSGSRSDKRRRK